MTPPTSLPALRWFLLRAVYSARPYAIGDLLIQVTLTSTGIHADLKEIRRELAAIESAALVTVTGRTDDDPEANWMVSLSDFGLSVSEYRVACPPMVARPLRRGGQS